MKRLVVLAVLSLVTMLLFAPVAFAQEEEEVSEVVETPGGGEVEIQAEGPPEVVEPAVQQVEQKAAAQPAIEGTVMIEATQPPTTEGTQPMPKTGGPGIGGPAVILPAAAALLLGSGILTYAALRHRRR
jgi:hypothetical protein